MTFIFAVGYRDRTWRRIEVHPQGKNAALDTAREQAKEAALEQKEIAFVKVLGRNVEA